MAAGFILIASMYFSSCKKDVYVYNVNDVTVQQPGSDKSNVKTTIEFISIAYTDLFNTSVPSDTLLAIQQAYDAFGDKKLIEDRVIRAMLNSPGVQIPTNTEMRADISSFTQKSFQKFFNRNPNEFESYFINNIIASDTSITPTLVYYAAMTSNEYRYY
jgi:hypothetical protein